ncbi:hypothetical protein DYD21_16450 [Rhodohalobacter sp. SW132]|uniref:glucosylglycerol hydrolase n=1 Tax=Rhodohalobacter sp. SW132 TaxID=2293433 RepID=UPI000E235CCE|nr:glucosylglycerol hydrolase [Rhodohalobacter sp. SW132]REL24755.1 hypothetical protein DYD21_16450 [Rhodohalobacter sp. SW132]
MIHPISHNPSATREFAFDLKPLIQPPVSLNRARQIAERLGCKPKGLQTYFLFWNPDFQDAESAEIQLYLPTRYLNFDKPEQHASFQYRTFPVLLEDEFALTVLNGVPSGDKESFGALYQVKVKFKSGREEIIRDPMAASLPYGVFAPAEVYDIDTMLKNRADSTYYEQLSDELSEENNHRIPNSVNLLELHVQTSTKPGTLYSLNDRFKQVARKLRSGNELTPDEKNLCGFDAVELMPLDPVVQHPDNHTFWDPIHQPNEDGEEVTVRLKRPGVLNWGYDISLFGSAAVNPSLLGTGRPSELLELIETLHTSPDPVKVVLDVVYGHADDIATQLLPSLYFTGPSTYGREIRIRHPMIRAVVLEMLRRKMAYGFDGIRVDASHDFKYYDEEKEKHLYDNDFLKEMSDITVRNCGTLYRPWMIFEDGRPWPRDDWQLAASYLEVNNQQEHAFQWAPTIFAYNTPYSYTYWVSKMWRLKEVMKYGERWISGYANHDTIRRGTQADPNSVTVNSHLGNSLKMVMNNAYNHPSTTLLMHGFLPGVPMDFLHALGHAPWSFIRDTDSNYALKVTAEEAYFLDWQVTGNEFRQSRFFKRLKGMGFHSLDELRSFTKALLSFVKCTDNDPEQILKLINVYCEETWTREMLDEFVDAWMQDLNCYCNVDNHAEYVSSKKAAFNLEIRKYRTKNPWLRYNFRDDDFLTYAEPVHGTVIYYGYRRDPESGKEIVFVANMEGQPRQIVPADLIPQVKNPNKWSVACSTPSITRKEISEPIRLSISQGLLFERS